MKLFTFQFELVDQAYYDVRKADGKAVVTMVVVDVFAKSEDEAQQAIDNLDLSTFGLSDVEDHGEEV